MAVGLVGIILSMIGGAVVVLDRHVANERLVAFPAADLASYNYTATPYFTVAPSRVAEAQAQSLWREAQELYTNSYAVTAFPGYLKQDYTDVNKVFYGSGGCLSKDSSERLPFAVLASPTNLVSLLSSRFPTSGNNAFDVWDGTGTSATNIKGATLFFLGEQDRILGILRARGFTLGSYRYYEVNLMRMIWVDTSGTVIHSWALTTDSKKIIEDFSYRFVEDATYPQPLLGGTQDILKWNPVGTTTNLEQVSLRQAAGGPTSSDYKWLLMLPDPSLGQAEAQYKGVTNVQKEGRLCGFFNVFP